MRGKKIAHNGFSVLGEETRLKIFIKIIELSSWCAIGDTPIIGQNHSKHLVEVFGLAKSTVAHHIKVLLNAELIFEVPKNRFVYLFPNYVKLIEFRNFINENLLSYFDYGKYILSANIHLKNLSDYPIESIKDFLIITGCKNVYESVSANNSLKLYFKFPGFNEPFYLLFGKGNVQIYVIEKNYTSSRDFLLTLTESFSRNFP